MPPPAPLQPQIEAIFNDAQQSLAKHRRCAERLRALQRKADARAFAEALFACIACVLPIFKREPAAERVVEFVVRFLTEAGEDDAGEQDELIGRICLPLLGLSDARDKAVRFRVSQLVGRIMNAMPEEAEVSDDLFVAVEERMLRRCRDKVPVVRACALRALFRLQDPSGPSDAISSELLRMMEHDSSPEVRMAAISTVAPSKPAIRGLLSRTRDVTEAVRKHALGVLREKVEMRWLTISQRAKLLGDALADRSPSVRTAAVELVRGWLRKADRQLPVLLKALDVASYETAAERVVAALLRDKDTAGLVGSVAADWASLAPEAVLCLRCEVEALVAAADGGTAADEEARDAALPELPPFCKALQAAVGTASAASEEAGGSGVANYSLVQLLRLCPRLDFADEYGRAELEAALCALLKTLSIGDELLPLLAAALRAACGGEDGRFQRLMQELISEVDDPLEEEAAEAGPSSADALGADERLQAEQQRMLAQARLVELHAEVKSRVEEEDFDAAAALQKEAAALTAQLAALPASRRAPEDEDALRTARCLRLSELLMRTPGLALGSHEMDLHADATFLPALAAPRPKLRALALRCLGLRALSDGAQAAKLWPLFVKALAHDQLPVQLAALGACADLLLVHSPAALLPPSAAPEPPPAGAPLPPTEDGCAGALLDLLGPALRSSDALLSASAALAACRLLHTGRVASSALVARLLVFYFQAEHAAARAEPLAEAGLLEVVGKQALELLSDPRQFLSVFFASAPPALLGSALLPALRTALSAPAGAPEASVPVESLASFVLALTRPAAGDKGDGAAEAAGEAAGEAAAAHEGAALGLCCETLRAPAGSGLLLPRAFPHLALPAEGAWRAGAPLAALLRKLAMAMTDRTALKHVQKLRERVEAAGGLADEEAVSRAEAEAEAILAAYAAAMGDSAPPSLSAPDGRRSLGHGEAAAELSPDKTADKGGNTKRRLQRNGKATPRMAARLVDAARSENVTAN